MQKITAKLNEIQCRNMEDQRVVHAVAVLASALEEHGDVDTDEAELIVAGVVELFNDAIATKPEPTPAPAPKQYTLTQKGDPYTLTPKVDQEPPKAVTKVKSLLKPSKKDK